MRSLTESHRLLTVNEVAEQFRLSRATIYRLLNSGQLTCLQIGSRKRFRPDHLEAFLCKNEGSAEQTTKEAGRECSS